MSILLIHSGGTIGMEQTDQGFAPREGVVQDAIIRLHEAGKITGPVEILRLDPLINSAEATPSDWSRIAEKIHDARESHEAFVVTHGTDTLAWTAAALCLALPGVQKPVIVTGAMRPLTVEGSDGNDNLIAAIQAARSAPPGVRVQFGGRLLHGARVRKFHSEAFDAFTASPGSAQPLVPSDEPGLNEVRTHKVAVLSFSPGFCAEILDHAAENCDGIILLCFGSGTGPDTAEIRAALEKARSRKVPVLAISLCAEGGIRPGIYAAGRFLHETGVIAGGAMGQEMAFAKMQFALSLFSNFEERRHYLATAQCGEM